MFGWFGGRKKKRRAQSGSPVPAVKQKEPKVDLLKVLQDKVTILKTKQRRPYTYVEFCVWHGDQKFETFGFSKVCHPDKWDAQKGVYWAITNGLIFLINKYHLRPEDSNTLLGAIYDIKAALH